MNDLGKPVSLPPMEMMAIRVLDLVKEDGALRRPKRAKQEKETEDAE